MYKTTADFCIINKECLEEYGSYFMGSDSYVVLIWICLYLKIDGLLKKELIYEDMTRNLLLNYWFELDYGVVFARLLIWGVQVKSCLVENLEEFP